MSTAQEIIDHLSTLDPDTKIATYHPDDYDRVVPLMARSGGVWTEDGELVHILFRAFPSLPIRHDGPPAPEFAVGDRVVVTGPPKHHPEKDDNLGKVTTILRMGALTGCPVLFENSPHTYPTTSIRHATAAEIAAETFFPGDVVRITDQVSGPALDDLGVGVIGVVTGISDYEDEIEPVEALFGDTYYIFAPEELEVLDDDDLTADVVGPILRSLVEETR